jgi:acyl dehydratase
VSLDPDKILSLPFAERPVSYTTRDAILYALCCGAGQADDDLSFLHEDGLRVIPSFGQNLCFDDSWLDDAGIDLAHVVHGGLDLRFNRPFAPQASLTVRPSVVGMTDKGEGRPGMVLQRTDILDGGETIFTSFSNMFVMNGGGFGGSRGEAFAMVRTPETPPDVVRTLATRPDSPLLFRLLGDLNPLHVLPEVARKAGFARPIMHGANTFGIACHDLLATFCNSDPARLKRFAARFSGPLYPGEHLIMSYWRTEDGLRFSARAAERDSAVLDGGLAEIG